jgi:hypothetical protein
MTYRHDRSAAGAAGREDDPLRTSAAGDGRGGGSTDGMARAEHEKRPPASGREAALAASPVRSTRSTIPAGAEREYRRWPARQPQ